MAEIRLERATKTFGQVHAVRELDLTIADGEFFVLLGPTGAGKTTTLRLVAGLEKLDGGRVHLGGRDVSALAPAARDVAFVFQQYALYPHYTVFDNLAFPLRSPLRRRSPQEVTRRVEEVAKLLRIESKLKNKATKLSGGEMQRVGIGRALVREPNCFLMDEPLSSLDAKLREDLRVELKHIQRDLGATILYVTHDQIEALTMADRIGVLEEGRLLQVGTPRDVYTRPASVSVARRLGSPAINLLRMDAVPGIAAPSRARNIGIRPEDVQLNGRGIEAEVEQVEHLGAESVVVLRAGEERMHALVSGGTSVQPGTAVRAELSREAMLFFDEAGQRVDA